MEPTPAPGWYPSPGQPGMVQWWDGTAWTETLAAPGVAAPPAGAKGTAEHWLVPTGRSAWAIAAGYLGLLSLLGIFAPFALVTGLLGLRQIKRRPELGGKGRAWFGVIMGSLISVFALIAIATG